MQDEAEALSEFTRHGKAADAQYVLYESWPAFRWKRTKERRRVQPPVPHSGAQYGWIDACDIGCGSCSITVAPPGGSLHPLSNILVDVLFRAAGRGFASFDVARRRRGWDRIIWDLLGTTVRAVSYSAGRAGTGRRDFGTDLFLARVSSTPPFFFDRSIAGDDGEVAAVAYLEGTLPPPEDPGPRDQIPAEPPEGSP